MINLKLANILIDIAEIKKADSKDKSIPVKFIKAARTLRDNPGIIERISAGKKKFAGMDESAYTLVREYLDTGRISLYEKIRAGYSREMIRLVRMSGLGKRRIFAIYNNFNLKNLEELKNALADSRRFIETVKGIDLFKDREGGFYVRRIKESLDYMESIKGKFPRWYAEFYLDKIKNSLKKIKDIEVTVVVGSLRRKKPVVRDIDMLLLPVFNDNGYDFARSENLLEIIKSLDFIKKIIKKDIRDESISAVFKTVFGIDIEFIVSSRRNWAGDLIYTTGSKKHVEKLERLAGRDNLRKAGMAEFNSIGALKDEKNCEQKTYNRFGMEYITPELREDRGEIELAHKNLLPSIICMGDIKGDLHVHSTWSDGLISLDDMIKRIKKFGYDYLAISDHSVSNLYGRGLNSEKILEKMRYIRGLKSKYQEFNILMGSEIDIRKAGNLDYDDDIIEKLDIVIGSLHSSFLNTKAENTAMAISAAENKYIDFIAHPTGQVFGDRVPYFIDIDRLISAAVENGKAMEINSYFLRLDLDEENARKVKDAGGKVVINTDAHRPNNMDMISLGVDVARRAGLEKKDVLNTLPLKEFWYWKRKSR